MFRSITEYDGTPLGEQRGSSVVSRTQASIDHLTVRTVTLNAYYDFPVAARARFASYVGAGLGPGFVKVSGVRFSSEYADTSGNAPAYDPPLSFYASRQDADLSAMSVVAWIEAEMEFPLSPSGSVRRCVRSRDVRVRSLCSGLFGRP